MIVGSLDSPQHHTKGKLTVIVDSAHLVAQEIVPDPLMKNVTIYYWIRDEKVWPGVLGQW